MDLPRIKKGKYRHYKGHLYKVVGLARHSETLEWMVVYEALNKSPKGKVWVRPYEMFIEEVETDGKRMPRFEYLGKK